MKDNKGEVEVYPIYKFKTKAMHQKLEKIML